MNFLDIPGHIAQNLDLIWTFILLFSRFSALFMVLPGMSEGQKGLLVRAPAIFVLSCVSMASTQRAALPEDPIIMAALVGTEFLLGFVLGMIPMLVIAAVQMGAQLATGTMGLGAAQLFDPTTGGSVSDLARIQGDLAVLLFLAIGGHYTVIYAASGLSGAFAPGAFIPDSATFNIILTRAGTLFSTGIMIAAPVVVALLLTQFVMGLISRAVPSINIFIVSFPLTIGIGFVITALALPEIMILIEKEYVGSEAAISDILQTTFQPGA